MKAVGRLIGKNKMGFEQAELWVNREWKIWSVSNPIDVQNETIGLFSFCPEDQFCKWIDPNKT